MSTPRYAMSDTKKPDGFYIQLTRVVQDDDNNESPDKHQDGYWPSRDKDAAGYCGEVTDEQFAIHHKAAEDRMAAWERGDWNYVGVRARALCLIVQNGVGVHMTLESPGLWGIESDCSEYLTEVYEEQCDELKDLIAAMQNPIYESK